MAAADYVISHGQDGVLRISQQSFWSVETARRFVEEASLSIQTARSSGPLRLVIDGTRFSVPSTEVSETLRRFDDRVRQEGDRVAMIVESSLLKMQMKRQIQNPGLEVFISPGAAETWVKG